jgi:GxxExxY protein
MDLNDSTYQINGATYEVNRELGSGFLEKAYENALMLELKERGLRAENQVPIRVKYKGREVGEYLADIVVEDKVLIELKTVDSIQKLHEAQLLRYLKATGYKVGLLETSNKPKHKLNGSCCESPCGSAVLLTTDGHRPAQTFYPDDLSGQKG